MSLINDALNKAARDRAEDPVLAAPLTARERAARRRESRRAQSFGLILLNAAALAAIFAVVVIVVLRNRTSGGPAVLGPSASVVAAPAVPSSLPSPEPSTAPVSSAPEATSLSVGETNSSPANPPLPDYEFTGMTAVGRDTFLSIARRRDQRSFWIPIGRSVGGITAVSYDERRDLAVIRVGGELVSLPLRNTAGTPATPAE